MTKEGEHKPTIPENGKRYSDVVESVDVETDLLPALEKAVLKVGVLQSEALQRIQELTGDKTPEAQALERLLLSPHPYPAETRFSDLNKIRGVLISSILEGEGKLQVKKPDEVVPWGDEGSDKSKEYGRYIAPLLTDEALALYEKYFPLIEKLWALGEAKDTESYTDQLNALSKKNRSGLNFATSLNTIYTNHQLFRELFGNNEDSLEERKSPKYPTAPFWEAFENRAKEDS